MGRTEEDDPEDAEQDELDQNRCEDVVRASTVEEEVTDVGTRHISASRLSKIAREDARHWKSEKNEEGRRQYRSGSGIVHTEEPAGHTS